MAKEMAEEMAEEITWSNNEVEQDETMEALKTAPHKVFIKYNSCARGFDYLPPFLKFMIYYAWRIYEALERGDLEEVLALLQHHRRQFGGSSGRMGGLNGDETLGRYNVLKAIKKRVDEWPDSCGEVDTLFKEVEDEYDRSQDGVSQEVRYPESYGHGNQYY